MIHPSSIWMWVSNTPSGWCVRYLIVMRCLSNCQTVLSFITITSLSLSFSSLIKYIIKTSPHLTSHTHPPSPILITIHSNSPHPHHQSSLQYSQHKLHPTSFITNHHQPWSHTIHTSPTNHSISSFKYHFPIHSFDWGRLLLTSHHISRIIKSSESKSNLHQQSTLPSYSTSLHLHSFSQSSLPNGCWTQFHNHQSHHTTHACLIQLSHITTHLDFPSQLHMGMEIDLFQFSNVPHSFISVWMACSPLFMCCCEGVEIIISSSTHNPILVLSSTQSDTGMFSILFSIKQTTGLMGSGNKRREHNHILHNCLGKTNHKNTHFHK